MEAQETWQVAGWAMLHTLGIVAAWVSRWTISRRVQQLNQLILAAAFLSIASLAVMHSSNGFHLSLLSATTLAAMVVAAVFDSRPEPENKVLTEVLAVYEAQAA